MLPRIERIAPYLPGVDPPKFAPPYARRRAFTGLVLCVFFALSHCPLYGLQRSSPHGASAPLRARLASRTGTFMELGLSPLLTASLLMQLVSSSAERQTRARDTWEKYPPHHEKHT